MSDTIIELQKRDHMLLDELLQRYERATPIGRRDTYREILNLVTTHAFAEETVLFPFSRRVLASAEAITSELESQHQRINELMKELEAFEPGEAGFEVRARELFPLLHADVRNEEDRLLVALEQRLGQEELTRLGTTWAIAKRGAPKRAHPGIPRRPPGNLLAGIPLFFVDRMRELLARWRRAPQ
ncbi:hemerythrin domain-containing protein [Cystobacter fuscus]|uniref:hemerythrin domain-containing protein n=1 Tax=Cystobacter fuscus TaxID=43 RepID=UPI002B2C4AF5|nr:hemerythrin domain-containing protein [Cystobacter fuscus]